MNMRAWRIQVAALKHQAGVDRAKPAGVFLTVVDSSEPDPEAPQEMVDYSDKAIIGFGARNPADRVMRHPGESMPALQKRTQKALPIGQVFAAIYAHQLAEGCTGATA